MLLQFSDDEEGERWMLLTALEPWVSCTGGWSFVCSASYRHFRRHSWLKDEGWIPSSSCLASEQLCLIWGVTRHHLHQLVWLTNQERTGVAWKVIRGLTWVESCDMAYETLPVLSRVLISRKMVCFPSAPTQDCLHMATSGIEKLCSSFGCAEASGFFHSLVLSTLRHMSVIASPEWVRDALLRTSSGMQMKPGSLGSLPKPALHQACWTLHHVQPSGENAAGLEAL